MEVMLKLSKESLTNTLSQGALKMELYQLLTLMVFCLTLISLVAMTQQNDRDEITKLAIKALSMLTNKSSKNDTQKKIVVQSNQKRPNARQ
jgi:hypothetical protein